MRRSCGLVLFVAVFGWLGNDRAFGQGAHDTHAVPGSQQIERHDPNSPKYADYSRGYSQQQLLRMQGHSASVVVRSVPRPSSPPVITVPIYGFYYGGSAFPYSTYYSS